MRGCLNLCKKRETKKKKNQTICTKHFHFYNIYFVDLKKTAILLIGFIIYKASSQRFYVLLFV